MDPTPPVVTPIPYKSRRGWLIAFGVIEILMGCGFLLMILFSAFIYLGPMRGKMPLTGIPPAAFLIMAGIQYGLLAAVFIAGGIGSIQCKNWARILMMVVSGLWLVFGFLGTLVMAFILPTIMHQLPSEIPSGMELPGKLPPGIELGVTVGMILFSTLLMVILPAIFLFFYSRKSVKATCLAQKGAQLATPLAMEAPTPGLPIPLLILGAWESFTALSVFPSVFFHVTIMFGIVLRGAAAVLVLLTYSLLSGSAAWMIFRQRIIGWQIALFKTGFFAISALVTYLHSPDIVQVFREMGYSSQMLRIYDEFPQFMPLVWLGSMVIMILLIVFILYTRQFFPKEGHA